MSCGKWLVIVVATLLFVTAPPVRAASVATTPHFTARLVAESLTPKAGNAVNLALVIKPVPGWHTYWQNPGESGFAPQLHWTLPRGVQAARLEYPTPSELVADGIASNVLAGPTALLTRLSIPATFTAGTRLPVSLGIHLLICSNGMCVPQSASLDLPLTTGDGAIDPVAANIFKAARAALPTSMPGPVAFVVNNGILTLHAPASIARDAQKIRAFISNSGVMPAKEHTAINGDSLTITMPQPKLAPNARMQGVIRVVDSHGQVHGYRFAAGQKVAAVKPANAGFWLALASALVGGFLLNLMPCVFPILSLKALALARAGGDDTEARMEALGYMAGAVGVLVGLGSVVIAVRAAGHAIGWAFQLQDARVVAILLLLVTAIGANLAGLFELPSFNISVGHRRGLLGGIATGSLAAFIATPCTGPFMAGALGAALLLPVPQGLAIFAGLGLGLSLPFLLLGYFAPARRWLPRPGPWMLTLRRLLSLPMFATAVGLAWIVGRQGGVSAMTIALAASVLLGVVLWWYGLRQMKGRSGYPVLVPGVAALALALLATHAPAGMTATKPGLLHSEPYTAARLARLRADHRPVFIYLTADWCLTCKFNEATSLSAASVARAFNQAHVAVLEGDWTGGNSQVTRLLAAHGRAGVPLYLWYPVIGHVRELPQVLSPTMLVDLVHPTPGQALPDSLSRH